MQFSDVLKDTSSTSNIILNLRKIKLKLKKFDTQFVTQSGFFKTYLVKSRRNIRRLNCIGK